MNFGDRAFEAVRDKDSCVVVGLDPVWERMPAHLRSDAEAPKAFTRFCCEIIEAVADVAGIVKPQIAFFERFGPTGLESFREVCRFAKSKGLLVIADVKRADIGSTSRAYADAYLGDGGFGEAVDAVTVNPYLGSDGLQPFFDVARERGKGVFVLVRTSNPGAGDIQDLTLSEDNRPVFEQVAKLVKEWAGDDRGEKGYSHVGAVVGATYPAQARAVREILPFHWLLVPGYGTQGATALDLKGLFDENGAGVLVNASRSIIYAWEREDLGASFSEKDFARAAQAAAAKMKDEINAVRR